MTAVNCSRSGYALFVAAFIVGVAMAMSERVWAAGGAFAVDDVEIGKPGDCKVESWISSASNRDLIAVTSPACVVNLGIPVELGGQLQRMRSDDVWGTSGGVKAKINLGPVEGSRPGVGLSGGTSWNLITGQSTGGFFNVPVTMQLHENFKVNINGGYQYDAANNFHYASWGAGFEWNAIDKVTVIGEIYGLAGTELEGRNVTGPRAQLGLRFTPIKSFDIDLIYGRNITGENADWITVGLNVRFP